jgi:hypothetical protein
MIQSFKQGIVDAPIDIGILDRDDLMTQTGEKRWRRRSELAQPDPKPSLLEKLVEYDRSAKSALGKRRKEMIDADT